MGATADPDGVWAGNWGDEVERTRGSYSGSQFRAFPATLFLKN